MGEFLCTNCGKEFDLRPGDPTECPRCGSTGADLLGTRDWDDDCGAELDFG